MSDHTPGPLAIRRQTGECTISGFYHLTEAGKDRPAVAYVINREDARLYSAAPDLLAVLREVNDWINNWSPDFIGDDEWPSTERRIRQAIAKAEDRS